MKDRIALSLIEQGEASGELTPDKIILESTSGNTGIGLAMVGAARGYKVVLTMSAAMSEERKKVLRSFGATLIETDPTKGRVSHLEPRPGRWRHRRDVRDRRQYRGCRKQRKDHLDQSEEKCDLKPIGGDVRLQEGHHS